MDPEWQGHGPSAVAEAGVGEGRREMEGGRAEEDRSLRIAGMALEDGVMRRCKMSANWLLNLLGVTVRSGRVRCGPLIILRSQTS